MAYRDDLEAAIARADAATAALAAATAAQADDRERLTALEDELAEAKGELAKLRARLPRPPEAPPAAPGAGFRAATWLGRHRTPVGMAVVLAVALGGLGVYWFKIRSRTGCGGIGGFEVRDVGGRETLIGVCSEGGGDLTVRLVAVDVAELEARWRSANLGRKASDVTFVGQHAVIADGRAGLHMVELTSGGERVITLEDRLKDACALSATEVLVTTIDTHRAVVDVISGSLRPARDATCPELPPGPKIVAVQTDGLEQGVTVVDGDVAVVAAVKAGTPVPIAVGFDPATGAERWRQTIAVKDRFALEPGTMVALGGGRYVVVYVITTDDTHTYAAALDARTGKQLWHVGLDGLFSVDSLAGVRVTARFVYISRTTSLDVLDAATGRLVGHIGQATYD